MRTRAKVGIVTGGYVAAIGAAMLAGRAYDVQMSKMPYDTSGGMYGAGEAMSSLGAFLVVALVPTFLALWFLRRHEGFWRSAAVGAVLFAAAGLVAVLTPLVARPESPRGAMIFVDLLGLAQLLGVPLWFGAFGVCSALAPTRASKRLLVAAVGLEAVIGVCALIHWFVPRPPL
jgi:hypothetical protein